MSSTHGGHHEKRSMPLPAIRPTLFLSTLLAALLGAGHAVNLSGADFSDLKALEFPEAARLASARGWLEGYPDGAFRPQESVSRAELVAVAVRFAEGGAEAAKHDCFPDVSAVAWYAPAVCRAADLGLVAGFPDGSFRPERPASAAASRKVLLAAAGLAPAASGPGWRQATLRAAAEVGLTPSEPNAPITRGELSLLLFGVARAQARRAGQALPSSGCRNDEAPPESLTVDGLKRDLIVSLPANYDASQSYPLVLAFHGRTGTGAQVQRYYGLERAGAEAIFVYPAGAPKGGGSSWTADETGGLAFFDQLLDALVSSTCTDLSRIFAVGHSLGASYVNALACLRGVVLRGVATLAGGRPHGDCRGRVAAMVIHNPDDRLAPFAEGLATVESLLAQNDLAATAAPSEPRFLNCERYGAQDALFPIVWCPHEIGIGPGGKDYPHTWPRGTGEAIMVFFGRLP